MVACFSSGNFLSDEIKQNPIEKAGKNGVVLREVKWDLSLKTPRHLLPWAAPQTAWKALVLR